MIYLLSLWTFNMTRGPPGCTGDDRQKSSQHTDGPLGHHITQSCLIDSSHALLFTFMFRTPIQILERLDVRVLINLTTVLKQQQKNSGMICDAAHCLASSSLNIGDEGNLCASWRNVLVQLSLQTLNSGGLPNPLQYTNYVQSASSTVLSCYAELI